MPKNAILSFVKDKKKKIICIRKKIKSVTITKDGEKIAEELIHKYLK